MLKYYPGGRLYGVMQMEKAEVLHRWKAGWSTMQVENAEVLRYTGGRLEERKYFFSIIPA
jgi:hypothetical protein